ncbi:MAG: RIO1 family regulatory kinase/ATPase [Methanolinea sp.]|nr:RIO1 family regulatory kinase/ATPase [Methanolinea sp.]
MPLSAETVRQLHPYEARVLQAIERLMAFHSWVPLDLLRKKAGLSENETRYRLGTLMEKGLVKYDVVPYEGYSLTFAGYDALALLALTRRGSLSALGPPVGEGKESVVYEGVSLSRVAVKCHHVGQRSFQSIRVARDYIAGRSHCPWVFASRASAEREYEALRRLHPHVRVPFPVDQNRGVVVMEYIDGTLLHRTAVEEPARVLAEILGQVTAAYSRGVIHADLSEFNVMLDGRGVVLIDWPQWVTTDHPNADEILARDISQIVRYFGRKYGVSADVSAEVARVTG